MFRCEGFLGHHAERVKPHAIMATTPQTLRKEDQSGDGRSSEEHALLLHNRQSEYSSDLPWDEQYSFECLLKMPVLDS